MFYYLPTHQCGLQSALLKLKREKNLYHCVSTDNGLTQAWAILGKLI